MCETKQLLVHIDFDSRKNMEVTEDQQLFGFPCSSKQYLHSVEERNSGLKQLLSKRWYKNKTPWQNRQTDGINFIFGWTIPLTLIKQQKTEKNHSLFLTEKLEYSFFRNQSIYVFMFTFVVFVTSPAKYFYCTWE